MARDLHSSVAVAVQEETIAPTALVELEFDSGTMRVWPGIGDLVWNGHTFTGVGTLGSIGPVEETTELRAVGVQLQLSGIPSEVLEIANDESWQGRPARIYFAVLSARSFVGEPLQIFGGLMDVMTLVEGQSATITLNCESNQIDLERTRTRRWTSEDLRSDWPSDKGLDMVSALQEKEILWGRQ
jgi:hypothetical protein